MLKLVSKDDTLIQSDYTNKVKGRQLGSRDKFDKKKDFLQGHNTTGYRHICRFPSFEIFRKYTQFTIGL